MTRAIQILAGRKKVGLAWEGISCGMKDPGMHIFSD
jgi:hypothetical protein